MRRHQYVRLHCWAQFKPESKEARDNPVLAIRYRYHIFNEENDEELAIDDLCFLGAFLTWTMCKLNIISDTQEQQSSKIFDAVSKGK